MNGKPRCGEEGCERIRSANIHVLGHPDFGHPYKDDRDTNLSAIGAAKKRFNASPAGKKYNAHTRELGKGETRCQIMSPVCTGIAQHQHEDKARGKAGGIAASIRKGTTLFDACDPCNGYCSENQVWARERGFIVSRRDIE